MDLILWRHADAHELHDGDDDLQRALTVKGERQAVRMAKWLDRQLPDGVRIYSSPARRAIQTVEALGRKYKVRDELSPQCDHTHLLGLAQWPEGKMTTLVVGHQPALGLTIAGLLGIGHGDFSVRKGGLWWLRSRVRDGQTQTVIVTVQSPDLL
jgi:phosphohistidine phosphatase